MTMYGRLFCSDSSSIILRMYGVLKRLADRLLALETLIEPRIGFELHERHLERDYAAVGLVQRLEDGGPCRSG